MFNNSKVNPEDVVHIINGIAASNAAIMKFTATWMELDDTILEKVNHKKDKWEWYYLYALLD